MQLIFILLLYPAAIKTRVEINKTENRKTIEKINETKRWFFEEINQIEKPLARLTETEKEKERERENSNY